MKKPLTNRKKPSASSTSARRKTYTLRFRSADRSIFDALVSGRKKVETRAASPRYRSMKSGEMVVLICGSIKKTCTIKRAKIFKTLSALLKVYKVSDIAPELTTQPELEKLYASFGGYTKKLKQFGYIALELR